MRLSSLFNFFIIISVFGVFVYSIAATFGANNCEYAENYLLCNAVLLVGAIMAPMWILMWPVIFLLFGLAMPFVGVRFIFDAIFRSGEDRLWNLVLGCALCTAAYFYTVKVAIPTGSDLIFPAVERVYQKMWYFLL